MFKAYINAARQLQLRCIKEQTATPAGRTCPAVQKIHVLQNGVQVHPTSERSSAAALSSQEGALYLKRGSFYSPRDYFKKNKESSEDKTSDLRQILIFTCWEQIYQRKKEKKKEKKETGALAPSLVRRVCTAFESLSPTHSRAAPKSLCCSYCLCCCEYFIRIFQYLFFYFCPCRFLTRPVISYILMHRAYRKQVCFSPSPSSSSKPLPPPPVQESSINHRVSCTSASVSDSLLAWN